MSENKVSESNVNIDVIKEREKPRLVALLFFDYINKTAEDKLNVLGIFDRIYVHPDMKKTHPLGFFIRTGYTFEASVEVVIFNPKDEIAAAFSFNVDKEIQRERNSFQMQLFAYVQFEVPIEGIYWFSVLYDGETIGGAGLKVEFKADIPNLGTEVISYVGNSRGDA